MKTVSQMRLFLSKCNLRHYDAAVHAAIRMATETFKMPVDRLILYGRSVGTGPAAAAAARMSKAARGPPAALILQSPFTSIQDFAKDKAGFMAYALVSERWPTKTNLPEVKCPMLLIHGGGRPFGPSVHSHIGPTMVHRSVHFIHSSLRISLELRRRDRVT